MSQENTNESLKNGKLRPLGGLDDKYFINDYQRGYRWTEQQVNDLLNDLQEFSEKGADKGRYFFQTIVAAPLTGGEAYKNSDGSLCNFEIIDGQQRLTTIYLINKILTKEFKQENRLNFKLYTKTRENNETFGNKIDRFLSNLENANSADEADAINIYFIKSAIKNIREFFNNKATFNDETLKRFYKDFCQNVYVLWYEPVASDQHERIATFTRLNMGKIPLTSAELSRALLLDPKYHIGGDDNQSDVDLRRGLIGAKWDQMEVELQDESFWGFLGQKHAYETRIDFLLNFHFHKDAKTKNYAAFKCLEAKLSELEKTAKADDLTIAQNVFDEIFMDFQRLKSFYLDHDIYHWLGFLNGVHSQNASSNFNLLYELKGKTKTQVKQILKAKIIDLWTEGDQKHRKEKALDSLHFDNDKAMIGRVLFFANVEYVRQQKRLIGFDKQNNSHLRYDFATHLATEWNIEHIHARNVEGLNTKAQWQTWLEDQAEAFEAIKAANIDIAKMDELAKLQKEVTQLLENIKKENSDKSFGDDFKKLADEVLKFFDTDGDDVNSLSNLALLDESTNKSINNSIYMVKQVKITDAINQGAFVPPLTQAVFMRLLSMSEQGSPFWGENDRKTYMTKITSLIGGFIEET